MNQTDQTKGIARRGLFGLLMCAGLVLVLGTVQARSGNTLPLKSTDTGVTAPGVKAYDRYMIRRGDTLGSLAKTYLGSERRWKELMEANPGLRPEKLDVGTSIWIPRTTKEETALVAPRVEDLDLPPFLQDAQGERHEHIVLSDPESPEFLNGKATRSENVERSSGKSIFAEQKYRLPDALPPEVPSPYSANVTGFHGLFNTESALYPENRTLVVGFHLRSETYQESTSGNLKLSGSQWIMPLNALYMKNRWMFGLSLPTQSWEVKRPDVTNATVNFKGLHDPEMRVGYRIWQDFAERQAVALHLQGRLSSGNYGQPTAGMNGTSKDGIRVGPAEATRGGWIEFGGAYSTRLDDRWYGHLNLALANDARDGITRFTHRGGLDYRMSDWCRLVAELGGSSWKWEDGPDGTNLNGLVGVTLFNHTWQFSLGATLPVQGDWGYKLDSGIVFGLNYRQY
ncbi:MAG TPA: LysM domain-containing protein [Candidatus Ozemobacteraceae bacterium]